MSSVDVCRNKRDGSIVLVPFAFGRDIGAGSVAAGKLVRLDHTAFLEHGEAHIRELLDAFWARDATEPSELYNVMNEDERNAFLEQHQVVAIFVRERKHQACIFDAESGRELLAIPYPPQAGSLLQGVLSAFELLAREEQRDKSQADGRGGPANGK